MRPKELLLRCYANKDGEQWQIFCIDLCLAAQDENFSEAQRKLHAMIQEYLYDALAGEDSQYADQLLNRRAPLKQIATYYCYATMHKIGALKDGLHRLFKLPMPLIPQDYAHE